MPTPGYVFKDGGTTPPEEKIEQEATLAKEPQKQPDTKPAPDVQSPLSKNSSESHALAVADHEITGAAQAAGKIDEVTDLGWRRNSTEVDNLVGGLPNDELWTLIRRFNKQMYHVKAIPQAPPGGLDLNVADQDEFSPDKLRSNIERLYMTVIIGLIGFAKHIARLRSWREPVRTSGFAIVYFAAWIFNLIVPTLMLTLIVLILVPQSRAVLFPPAPLALVSHKTGGIQKPKAGVLGSHDSATGAPEKHQGEAVEQEASNLVNGIATVAISSAAGKHEQADPEGGDPLDSTVPDPTNIANVTADSKDAATGGIPTAEHDKTKKPMEDAIWQKMRPAMHTLGDICDGWERFGNALSPTPPFSHAPRYRLAALVLPLLLVSTIVTNAIFMKANTLILGAAFFSDPLLQRGIQILNEKIPDWQKYLEIRNSILKGVPTNAQLTITLLRIGEANRAPLPPPPKSDIPPPEEPAELDKKALADSGLNTSQEEIEDIITVDQPEGPEQQPAKPKKKAGSRIVSFFKGTTAGAIETKFKTDNVKAAIGSEHAKQHLGILPKKGSRKAIEGPVEFKGRYRGRKGAVYIDSSVAPATSNLPARPCVYFTNSLNESQDESIETSFASRGSNPAWALPVSDIAEIKKLSGLGWKAKIIVGWATEKEIKDGIEIIGKDGKGFIVTALREREELFNRLVAMGAQVWESY